MNMSTYFEAKGKFTQKRREGPGVVERNVRLVFERVDHQVEVAQLLQLVGPDVDAASKHAVEPDPPLVGGRDAVLALQGVQPPGVDRRAAGQESVRRSRPAVVLKRAEQSVGLK